MSGEQIPVAVVGCGSFGRNHARVYAQMPGAHLVGVYDADLGRAETVAKEYGTTALRNLEEVSEKARAVSVAVPTRAHAEVAVGLMEAGADVLVEKPIAPDLAQADEILTAAERLQRVLMVGHLERFNPAVRLMRHRVTRPLFFEVHRLSVFTPRSLDVDVLLDLMIHDLDIVLSFVRDDVSDLQAVGLPVLTRHVDIANVRLSFKHGCVANLTASRVSTEKVRKLRFFQPDEYVSLDFTRRDARIIGVERENGEPAGIVPALFDGSGQPEPLAAELEAFLSCVRTRKTPEVDGAAARAALATALRAAGAIAEHAKVIGVR